MHRIFRCASSFLNDFHLSEGERNAEEDGHGRISCIFFFLPDTASSRRTFLCTNRQWPIGFNLVARFCLLIQKTLINFALRRRNGNTLNYKLHKINFQMNMDFYSPIQMPNVCIVHCTVCRLFCPLGNSHYRLPLSQRKKGLLISAMRGGD